MSYYFDTDFEDAEIEISDYRRYSTTRDGRTAATQAARLFELAGANSGQIGIYRKGQFGEFFGYVIKYPGEEPYFEDDVDRCSLTHRFCAHA